MPGFTFYGALQALFQLADEHQLQRLQSAWPPSIMGAQVSPHDHTVCDRIHRLADLTFFAVLLALVSQADTDNLAKLDRLFPDATREARIRYFAPEGCLNTEEWLKAHSDVDIEIDWLEEYFTAARFKADKR